MLCDLEVLLLDEQIANVKLFPHWLIFFRPVVDRAKRNGLTETVVISGVARELGEQTRKMEASQANQLKAHKHWQGDVHETQAKAEVQRKKEVAKQLALLQDKQDQVQAQQVQIKEQQAQMQAELEKLVGVVGAALKPWEKAGARAGARAGAGAGEKPEPEPEPESSK